MGELAETDDVVRLWDAFSTLHSEDLYDLSKFLRDDAERGPRLAHQYGILIYYARELPPRS